jgi:hypothetical protein
MSSVPSSIHATAAKVHFLPRIFVLPINNLLDATAWHASGIPEVDPDLYYKGARKRGTFYPSPAPVDALTKNPIREPCPPTFVPERACKYRMAPEIVHVTTFAPPPAPVDA